MSVPEQQTSAEPTTSKLVWVPIVIGAFLVLTYWIYFGRVKHAPAGGPDSWGQFGDFLGGLLNPVVGTITIVLLVRTLQSQLRAVDLQRNELTLQRSELQLQREETVRSTAALAAQNKAIMMQSFEQTFFAWLQSYRQFVNSLNAGALQGYQVLQHGVRAYAAGRPNSGGVYFEKWSCDHIAMKGGGVLEQKYENARTSYEQSYTSDHAILGPLLRSLYRLIDWIDKSPIPTKEKWHYVAIARSQLTWPEMMILAYNGTTERGQKFLPLVEKYALLDNLEGATDYIIAAMRGPFLEYPPAEFPYTARAFDSTLAKAALGAA